PGAEIGAVGLAELEEGGEAVAEADVLVESAGFALGRAGLPIERVAPAEAVQTAAALLEEGDDGVKVVERLDAVAGIVGPPRVGPARVALLRARAQHDDIGAALGAAVGGARDGGGEAGVVEHLGERVANRE